MREIRGVGAVPDFCDWLWGLTLLFCLLKKQQKKHIFRYVFITQNDFPPLYLEYVTTSWNNVVTRLPAKLKIDGLHQESPTKTKTSLNLAKAVGVQQPPQLLPVMAGNIILVKALAALLLITLSTCLGQAQSVGGPLCPHHHPSNKKKWKNDTGYTKMMPSQVQGQHLLWKLNQILHEVLPNYVFCETSRQIS